MISQIRKYIFPEAEFQRILVRVTISLQYLEPFWGIPLNFVRKSPQNSENKKRIASVPFLIFFLVFSHLVMQQERSFDPAAPSAVRGKENTVRRSAAGRLLGEN